MPDYPVMLQLKGRRCVIVGAGPVGRRKLQSLLPVEADLVLVAPDAQRDDLPEDVTIINRSFIESDLDDAALVFAATDSVQTNQRITAAARARKIPVNNASDPQASDFTLPAVARHADLTVAVGTAGRSPAAAAAIRDALNKELGPGWGAFVDLAAKLRALQLTSDSNPLYNQQVLHIFLKQGLIRMLESGDRTGIERLLQSEFDGKIRLEELDISLPKGAS